MSKKTKYALLVIALVIGLVAAGLFTTNSLAAEGGSQWGQKGGDNGNRPPGSGWGGCSPGQDPPCGGQPGWSGPTGDGKQDGYTYEHQVLASQGALGDPSPAGILEKAGESNGPNARDFGPPGDAGPKGSGHNPGEGPKGNGPDDDAPEILAGQGEGPNSRDFGPPGKAGPPGSGHDPGKGPNKPAEIKIPGLCIW